jgi:hypothetical protein
MKQEIRIAVLHISCPISLFIYVLWHVGPLLGNDREMGNYTTAVAK